MFPHLQETSMNKTIQKKVELNVILTVFIGVQLVTKGVGQEKISILLCTSDLFGILKNIFKLFFLPVYLELVLQCWNSPFIYIHTFARQT